MRGVDDHLVDLVGALERDLALAHVAQHEGGVALRGRAEAAATAGLVADDVSRLQRHRGLRAELAGGSVARHIPVVDFAKSGIRTGEYGELITAASRRVSSLPSRIKDVGVVMDLGIHDIDVIQHVVDRPAKSAYTLAGSGNGIRFEDHANILIDFEGGATGFIEVNWLTPMKVRKLALTCSKNFIELDYMDQSAQVCSSSFKPFESGNLFNVPIEFDLRRIALRKEEPLRRELSDFVSAVEGSKEPLVSGESAVKTLKIAEAALRSVSSGRAESVG